MAAKEFAVIGLGNFGATVARSLSDLKGKVTAIDVDKAKVQDLQDDVDTAIVADATEPQFLENLEVDKFECFVVSTGVDSHAAILITLHLHEMGAKKIIVKANSSDHARILLKVGASQAIIPEEQMARKVAHSLAQGNVIDYLPLAGDFCVAEIEPPEDFLDKSLIDLKLRSQYGLQVIAVKGKLSGKLQLAPPADFKVGENDILVVLGRVEDVDKVRK
ncbi:MAG: TrkA family potassium uptake protein [Candidatus Zixiibacteriota bacterium]|nr:MAG: TrkA family potassium uptake protein [candidate division Zixibacteria bacterium]